MQMSIGKNLDPSAFCAWGIFKLRLPYETPGLTIRFLARQYGGGIRYEAMVGEDAEGVRHNEQWLAEIRCENGRWAVYDDMSKQINSALLGSLEAAVDWIARRWGPPVIPTT